MALIHRRLSETVRAVLPYFPVITITGPRQSGKTTLCKNLFSDLPYYNLEDPETLYFIVADPKAFLEALPDGAIIDEAHHFPQLLSYLQVIVDENPAKRFIVTGSSNFSLLQNITQSLAGRTAVLTLLPLSLKEIGGKIGDISTDTLILNGGYPHIWANEGFPRMMFYKNYYGSYIERDVRRIENVKDLLLFRKFITLCTGRIGSEFIASNISNEVGVAVSTIINWMSILAASYIAYQLPPYFANVNKRLVKTPKLYFYDVGLACYLLGIENEEQLSTHPLRGNLFENLVVNEALKERLNEGKDPNLYFFKDKSQREVDLVHTHGQELQAYEIKSAQTYTPSFYNNIDYFKKLFGDRVTRTGVIYDGKLTRLTEEKSAQNFRDFHLE